MIKNFFRAQFCCVENNMDSLLEEQRKINQELMNEMKNMQMQASLPLIKGFAEAVKSSFNFVLKLERFSRVYRN
jgi:hypothetical protein